MPLWSLAYYHFHSSRPLSRLDWRNRHLIQVTLILFVQFPTWVFSQTDWTYCHQPVHGTYRQYSSLTDQTISIPPHLFYWDSCHYSPQWYSPCCQSRSCCCTRPARPLNAAFDTVDHSTLLNLLQSRFSVLEQCLAWFQSYLSGRIQVFITSTSQSAPVPLVTGVPQGSVLGPIQFIAYTTDISDTFTDHNLLYHMFADDTQMY